MKYPNINSAWYHIAYGQKCSFQKKKGGQIRNFDLALHCLRRRTTYPFRAHHHLTTADVPSRDQHTRPCTSARRIPLPSVRTRALLGFTTISVARNFQSNRCASAITHSLPARRAQSFSGLIFAAACLLGAAHAGNYANSAGTNSVATTVTTTTSSRRPSRSKIACVRKHLLGSTTSSSAKKLADHRPSFAAARPWTTSLSAKQSRRCRGA